MRYTLLTLIAALASLASWAVEVNCTPGALEQQVTDHSITALTVTGQMDARDFLFVADSLKQLNSIDLSNVEIVAYTSIKPIFGTTTHHLPMTLPTASLAGKPLTSVALPDGLKTIGEAAFAGCDKLVSIALPQQLDTIGNYAFSGCSALSTVTLPATVAHVGNGAFAHCTALTSATVDNGSRLQHVGNEAFMDCPLLTTLTLGGNVVTIGHSAFAGTGLKALDLTTMTKLEQLGDWAMTGTPITEARLPQSLQTLGTGAMLYLPNLTQVTMPGSLTTVSDFLLAGSDKVSIISAIPEGVQTIGQAAFYNLSTVTTLSLPSTLQHIGTLAMAGMTGLEEFTSNAVTVPTLDDDIWLGVDQGAVTLKVPINSVEDYQAAAQWQEFLIVPSAKLGDVNGDGEVNVADVSALVAIVMGDTSHPDYRARADVNGDTEISVADVSSLVAIVMSGINAPAIYPDVDRLVTVDALAIAPGESQTLNIRLSGAQDYNAMQFDVDLPQGLSVTAHESTKSHQVLVDHNTGRVMVYSMQNSTLNLANQGVIHLTVTANRSLADEAQITLNNIVLADNNAQAHYAPSASAPVNNITGINDLTAASHRVWTDGNVLHIVAQQPMSAQIVAINGTMQQVALDAGDNAYELTPGIYVVHIDGRGHKVVVK